MQPKSSQLNTKTTSTSNQSTTLVLVERFKEQCLRNNKQQTNVNEFPSELNTVIEYFFDLNKDIFKFLSDFDLLKLYVSGGIGLDSFNKKVFNLNQLLNLI